MSVRVVLHFEALDNGGRAWWAESPAVPAFSATDSSLTRLVDLCVDALVAEGLDAEDIEWSFAVTREVAGTPSEVENSDMQGSSADGVRQLLLVPA